MSYLKDKNVTKCFSLLREFIEETSSQDNKKRTAVLALGHLQKITAGTDWYETSNSVPRCVDTPRINGIPGN
jgi:hypothetical protein